MSVKSAQPETAGAIVKAGITSLTENVVVSNLVTREGLDQWRGKPGMTVETTVPGVLPYREYEWHNDRSEPIITDDYSETVVSNKIGIKRPYSAVRWTDEEEFDFSGDFGRVFNAQMDAVGRAIENYTLGAILNAPYERVIDIKTADIASEMAQGRDVFHNAFVEAKSAISRMRVPYTSLVAVCSDSFADEIEKNQKLTLNQGRGDGALGSAHFGSLNGIQLVRANWVPDGVAYIFDKSAFVLHTAVPRIPRSVPFGATASVNGFALSWLMDYASGHLEDRSVFHCYAGATHTLDNALSYAPWLKDAADQEFFTRGIVLGIDGVVKERKPGDGNSDAAGGDADSVLAQVYNKTLKAPGLATEGGTPFPSYLAHPGGGAPVEEPGA